VSETLDAITPAQRKRCAPPSKIRRLRIDSGSLRKIIAVNCQDVEGA
jgi:hypothetical protein